MYNIIIHTCEGFGFQIWSSYAFSRSGPSSLTWWWVSYTGLECHLWNMFASWYCPKRNLRSCILQWATPMCKKVCLLAQVLVTFYGNQTRIRIHFGPLFSLISKGNLTRFVPLFLIHHMQDSPCQVVGRWCEVVIRNTLQARDDPLSHWGNWTLKWAFCGHSSKFVICHLYLSAI